MKKLFRDTLVNHGQTDESLHKHHLFYSSNTVALEGLHDKDIIVISLSLKPFMKFHEVVSKIQTNLLFTFNNDVIVSQYCLVDPFKNFAIFGFRRKGISKIF